jgi:sugar/nucleoside kinase (ribokinase family)
LKLTARAVARLGSPHRLAAALTGDGMDSREKTLIVGVGSALVDILLRESDDFIEQVGARKGGMTLVDADTIGGVLARSANTPSLVPGGSACNTVVGVGRLGGKARFVGKRGRDELGEALERDLRANNVEPVLLTSGSPTGRVLSIITPDAQRSMFTFLGASAEARPEEIRPDDFADAAIVHVEGYLLFNRELIAAALKAAKLAGARVSFDLASYTVVEAAAEVLDDLVCTYVDILLANEDEARSYTGRDDEEGALAALEKKCEIAVVKKGRRGSLVSAGGRRFAFGIKGSGDAVDTTGAGDLWASGFLYGLVNGLSMQNCGELAAACGYEVCQVVGAAIPDEGWQRIRRLVGPKPPTTLT